MTPVNDQTTKRVMVYLYAIETMLPFRRIVVEFPVDADEESVRDVGGSTLDEIATANECDSDRETQESEGFEVLTDIEIVGEATEHLDSDVVLVYDDAGNLVSAQAIV